MLNNAQIIWYYAKSFYLCREQINKIIMENFLGYYELLTIFAGLVILAAGIKLFRLWKRRTQN